MLALRRDLSMSKDMRDLMRANVGFAAKMFKGQWPPSLTLHNAILTLFAVWVGDV